MQRCPKAISRSVQRRKRRVEVLAHADGCEAADVTVTIAEQFRGRIGAKNSLPLECL
jgi:hypothetical protein